MHPRGNAWLTNVATRLIGRAGLGSRISTAERGGREGEREGEREREEGGKEGGR